MNETEDACHCMCRQHGLEDPVCIVDLGVVARLFRDWTAAMPRVVPFYAVKANNDKAMIAMLAALGAGFDCASDAEVCTASQAFGWVHKIDRRLRIILSLGSSPAMPLMAKEWRVIWCPFLGLPDVLSSLMWCAVGHCAAPGGDPRPHCVRECLQAATGHQGRRQQAGRVLVVTIHPLVCPASRSLSR